MTEREPARNAARRLAIIRHAEEATGNVARTCRHCGISRQVFYTWKRRFDEEGVDGPRDRSSRPLRSPGATKAEVVGKIVHLRQHYHFGPRKISMHLKRYHDIEISSSGVWRILNCTVHGSATDRGHRGGATGRAVGRRAARLVHAEELRRAGVTG